MPFRQDYTAEQDLERIANAMENVLSLLNEISVSLDAIAHKAGCVNYKEEQAHA